MSAAAALVLTHPEPTPEPPPAPARAPASRQKVRGVQMRRAFLRKKGEILALRKVAVGGREILRWRQQDVDELIPQVLLTRESLEAASFFHAIADATPRVADALYRLIALVVACWADGGRALCAENKHLAELLGISERSIRTYLVRLMACSVLCVDRDYYERDGKTRDGKSYSVSQRPNLFSPGMFLRTAAMGSGVRILPREEAELHGWVVQCRRRYDGEKLEAPRAPRRRRRIASHSEGVSVVGSAAEGSTGGLATGALPVDNFAVGADAGADGLEKESPSATEIRTPAASSLSQDSAIGSAEDVPRAADDGAASREMVHEDSAAPAAAPVAVEPPALEQEPRSENAPPAAPSAPSRPAEGPRRAPPATEATAPGTPAARAAAREAAAEAAARAVIERAGGAPSSAEFAALLRRAVRGFRDGES